MNHIYRSIWSKKTGTFVAVSENTKNGGKSASGGGVVGSGFALKTLALALSMAFGSHVYALPVNGIVSAGDATITSGAGNTTVKQGSQNVALNWQSFNIGKGEAVTFVQPNSSSVALNRVLGADPSSILGNLSANGKVFLINPNGILFGQGASVNVGGLVASTLNLSDSDFMVGRYKFAGSGSASILNQGSINADGGYVALLGAHVSNQGTIAARLGTVALAAGNAITLDVAGDGFINLTVDQGALKALVDNGGMIQADGGHVLLSAQAAGQLLHTVVNNTGIIQAQSITEHNGTIRLLGDMQSGSVHVGGKLDASAPAGGNGGFIDTSAAQVKIADGARVTTAAQHGLTGSWLIDPVDFTIAPGSAAQTGSGIGATTLSSNLASGNVSIVTGGTTTGNGDIFVNSAVSWAANKLTLSAHRDININANLNATATASLALNFGQGAVQLKNTSNIITNGGAAVILPAGTTNFTTKQGSDGAVKNYTVITSLGAAGSAAATDLQGIAANLSGNYALGSNIDATATSGWNAGAGFAPIGSDGTRFTGVFDGLGHTISGVYINRKGSNNTGLFGYTAAGSMVRNVGLIGGSVASDSWATGSLVGQLGGTLINSYATGSVSGFQTVGGLVGVIDGGAIVNSHATGAVVAVSNGEAGGLVGLIWGNPAGTVTNSYATGNVSSAVGNVGGLVGINWGTVTGSYATGTAHGTDYIGGLIGNNSRGSIVNSYATGAASGNNQVGGLAGNNSNSITNSHATGAVSGSNSVGGFVGANGGTVDNSYASGSVTSVGGSVGGLVGDNRYGTISNSYASGAVVGGQNVGGLVGYGYGGTITNSYASGAVVGGQNVGGLVGYSASGMYGMGATIDTSYATGAVTGSAGIGGLVGYGNVGTIRNSFWNTQTSGVAISAGGIGMTTAQMQTQRNFASATAANGNVNPAWDMSGTWVMYEGHTSPLLRSFMTALTVTAGNASKTYDGLAYSGGNGVTYSSTPNMSNVLGTASYSGTSQGAINAGTYGITASGLYSNQQGYIISYVAGGLTVDKANLTLAAGNVTKAYDGSLTATGTATVTGGTLFGSDALSGGTFAFTDKNAGAGNKTVTANGVTVSDGNSGGNYNVSYADNSTSTINQAVLTATAAASNKTYDGTTTAAAALSIASGLVGSETVTASGGATFNSKDVANATLVTVNSTALADGANGGLASNYRLAGGQTAAATIAAKALTISGMAAANKTYDGNTAATLNGGTLNGLIGTETLALTGQKGAFADKNVGTAKAVTVTGTALANGTGLAGNYSIANPTGLTADITRLSSVAWVGGASGNWFDAGNWAGGAVPDLANVANVVIPAGVSVTIDKGIVVMPAQAGNVNVESIGSGGRVSMVDGSLSVVNSVKLASIAQSGGTFKSGTIEVGTFTQSGGSLTSSGNLTVTKAYSQSGSGASVNVGGNASINQTSGSAVLGNITTAGSLGITAVNGNIIQVVGTRMASTGAGTLSAPNGTVSLAGSGNSLAAVTISDSTSFAASSGGANDARLHNALASALSMDGMNAPERTAGASSSAAGQSTRRLPSGSFAASILTGLNVTLVGQGVKLPPGVQPGGANDDEK